MFVFRRRAVVAAICTVLVSATVATEHECAADVVLLLDGSGSISSTSWDALLKASETFASDLGLSSEGAHIGVVQFATR